MAGLSPSSAEFYDLTETGRGALLRWPQTTSSPDLQYSVIGMINNYRKDQLSWSERG